MIALTSEYHLHARNSLLTEINRCRVGDDEPILIWRCVIFFVLVAPSGVYVKNYFFWKICAQRIVHSLESKRFFFGFRLYIHSDMIALPSEYHLHARNSLLTEINRCRVGQKCHIRGVIWWLCQ